jgi:two-component system chemotaxis response regulator CheB
MINVLVVEDSAVIREFLVHVLSTDPAIRVVGTAVDGLEALEAVRQKRPDVITMDVHMPKMNGYDATRHIMETFPTPIIIVSGSSTQEEISTPFLALESGALAVIHRPTGPGHPEYATTSRELVQTVKLMAEVKVVRRWARRSTEAQVPPTPKFELKSRDADVRIVAVGASTGGPVALETILSLLPKDFPVPILVVQHMATGFLQGFVEWLTQSTGNPVHIAAHGEQTQPGHVYTAPDSYHMGVQSNGQIQLSKDAPENGLRPSVAYLFRSVANSFGRNAMGILLTGMGKDGAVELKTMNELGAATIAQDEESSVVYGMPGEAVAIGAAAYVMPPEKIAAAIIGLTRRHRNS